jgi:RNA polymerase sigma-70 factor (ECF subfamily)
MTESTAAGHSWHVAPALVTAEVRPVAVRAPTFAEIYDENFVFVWRSLRQLGVIETIDDAVQDVFLVVHRRLSEFEGRSSVRTWLFGIALRVAKDHRRLVRRKGGHDPLDVQTADRLPGPDARAEATEALRLVHRLLDGMSEAHRAVIVLADLEQMSAPEMAEVLGVPMNTVYSRLRAARRIFEEKWRAEQGGDDVRGG